MSTKPASEAEEAQAKAEGSEEPSKEEAKEEAQAEEPEPEPELSLEEQQQLQIEELQGARDEMENRWKRAMADSENARQQAKREIASAKKFAVQAFAKSMLDVCDNLQLALEHTPEDQRVGDANPPLKALFEGVEMTEKILMQNLEKHGVSRFNPVNETFDPNVMMALFEMPDPDKEPGTVAQVIKTGYMLHDRVLRPAEVGVVKKP